MGGERKMRLCGQPVSLEYVLSLLMGLVALVDCSNVYLRGRHVCVQQRQSAQPVPYRQSYRRAVYQQTMQMCEGRRLCSRLSLTYQTAFRTVFHMQIRTHFVHGCCPGWKQASPNDKSCSSPVCSQKCENDGMCVGPDTCECPKGWTGDFCQKDVNECEGHNRCQQVCQNLPGSYECSCQDGFKIADDKESCTICLSCLPEFKMMQSTITTLTNRVEELETEKDMLLSNLTSMTTHYDDVVNKMQAVQAATAKAAATTTPPYTGMTDKDYDDMMAAGGMISVGFDRLASLSNQIGLLEERMADCTCRDYDNSGS